MVQRQRLVHDLLRNNRGEVCLSRLLAGIALRGLINTGIFVPVCDLGGGKRLRYDAFGSFQAFRIGIPYAPFFENTKTDPLGLAFLESNLPVPHKYLR